MDTENQQIETKTCKYCQSEIPKKAKICPVCKKKQKGKGKLVIIAAIIILIIAIAAAGGGNKSSTSSGAASEVNSSTSKNDAENTTDEDDGVVLPGESFEAKGLKVTVNDAAVDYQLQDNPYGMYNLDDGKMYVAVSFTFENTGKSDVYVSIYDFDCYADNTLCEQQYISEGGDFVNANLSAGRSTSFTTYYAVPADAKTIELEYTANVWTSEKVIVKVQ